MSRFNTAYNSEYTTLKRHIFAGRCTKQGAKMQWVRVKENLPKLKERVLLFDNGGFGVLTGRRGTAGWYLEGELDHNSNITHWMPLPPPPTSYNSE